jgi:hypothetical protein
MELFEAEVLRSVMSEAAKPPATIEVPEPSRHKARCALDEARAAFAEFDDITEDEVLNII